MSRDEVRPLRFQMALTLLIRPIIDGSMIIFLELLHPIRDWVNTIMDDKYIHINNRPIHIWEPTSPIDNMKKTDRSAMDE